MSWGFIGLAIGSLTAYLVVVGSTLKKVMEEIEEIEETDIRNP